MCLKTRFKRNLGQLIVSFHMMLLHTRIVKVVKTNWLLKHVPSLMGWKPVVIYTSAIKDKAKDAQA